MHPNSCLTVRGSVRVLLPVVVVIAAVLLGACGDDEAVQAPIAPPTAAATAIPTVVPTATPSLGELVAGVWEGTVTIQGNPIPLKIVFYDDPGSVSAAITAPTQGVADFPLTNVRLSSAFEALRIEFDFPEIESVWIGGLRGDAITGDFYQPNVDQAAVHGVFELKRVGDAPERPISLPAVPAAGPDREVGYGDAVEVHYQGTLDNGVVFDSSEGREPLSFTVGSGQVIPGFDQAVLGLSVGDEVTVRIEPENAYGPRLPDLVVDVPTENMPEGLNVGDKITSRQGATALVVEVDEELVRIDANHELAGEALTFRIELVSIR